MSVGKITWRELILVLLGLAWPASSMTAATFFPQPMLKRTEAIAIAEHECKVTTFTTFIMYEKNVIRRGMFDYYSGSHNISWDELTALAKSNGVKLNNLEHNLSEAAGYYGKPNAVACMDGRMRVMGYDRRSPYGGRDHENRFKWLVLDKAS